MLNFPQLQPYHDCNYLLIWSHVLSWRLQNCCQYQKIILSLDNKAELFPMWAAAHIYFTKLVPLFMNMLKYRFVRLRRKILNLEVKMVISFTIGDSNLNNHNFKQVFQASSEIFLNNQFHLKMLTCIEIYEFQWLGFIISNAIYLSFLAIFFYVFSSGHVPLHHCPPRHFWVGCWWLTPVILATQEVEIWRIMIWGQLRKNKFWDPISTNS
jgi:hypothetical protein